MSGARPLVAPFDAVLFDLDGVVYVGDQALPYAAEAVTRVHAGGRGICYVTNNASRTPLQVAEHLQRLGLPATREEVLTSSQAGAAILATQLPAGSRVLAVGGEGVGVALRERGFAVVDALRDPLPPDGDDVAAVMQGFGRDVGWRALARASFAVARGALWVATNTDRTIPVEGGIAPGNGMLVEAVAAATGCAPQIAGKPFPATLELAARRLGASRPLVVGDRLDTDIEGASVAGMTSLLVLTGVTKVADLWKAAPVRRPTYMASDLRGLHMAAPSVTTRVKGAVIEVSCGDASATFAADGRLHIDGASATQAAWAVANLIWESGVDPDPFEGEAADLDRAIRAERGGG